MFALCVSALLCLVSVSHSAPLDCEVLVRPLDQLDLNRLDGRWELAAGSVVNPTHMQEFRTKNAASIVFANNGTSFTHILSFDGSCDGMTTNITFEGSSFVTSPFNNITFLHTSCADCLVTRMDNNAQELNRFYLFSRRREVEQAEMDEFAAQAECLKMPPPVSKDPTKKLCPEKISDDQDAQTEQPTEGQKA